MHRRRPSRLNRSLILSSALALVFSLGHVLPASAMTSSPSCPVSTESDPAVHSDLLTLFEQSQEAELKLSPLSALLRGDKRYADQYGKPLRPETLATRKANKEAEYKALKAIDKSKLGEKDRIAYEVFENQTEHELRILNSGLRDIETMIPLNIFYGAHVSYTDIASGGGGVSFNTLEEYKNGLSRLKGFAAHMRYSIEKLSQGLNEGYVQPRITVESVLTQVDNMLALSPEDTPFYQPLKSVPDTISTEDRTQLQAEYASLISDEILPVYQQWKTFLSQDYLPKARSVPGLTGMKDGDALYQMYIESHTTTDLTADEVHSLGKREVARLEAEMKEAQKATGFKGDLQEFFVHLRTDPSFVFATPDDFFNAFMNVQAHVIPRMPDLFFNMQKAEFDARPLPGLGENRGSGYYRSGPPDASAPGVLYVNVSDMRSRPIWQTESLYLHEAIPGHHYQGSLARESTDLPDLLRFARYTAYSEGWGLYAESLGKELGLYTDPYQWVGHLDWEMLRAVRLVVDSGIHAKGWSRQQAIDYFLAHSAFTEKDATMEVDRYISMPGQALAYKVGELKLQELRQLSQKTLGDGFDIRAYHEQVLNTGPLPLSLLEDKITSWLKTAKDCQ